MTSKKKKNPYTLDPDEIEFEPEGEPEEPQLDTIFVRDGKGRAIIQEVPDDD